MYNLQCVRSSELGITTIAANAAVTEASDRETKHILNTLPLRNLQQFGSRHKRETTQALTHEGQWMPFAVTHHPTTVGPNAFAGSQQRAALFARLLPL